jgi:DNA helicase-2/ATP-dependent DNA helicase PcrA
MKETLVLGGPGCGKTTKLMDLIEKELESGVAPKDIMFCSFTKKATQEALSRVEERFKINKKELPYFKTLHAFAFHQLGLSPSQVMSSKDYEEIGRVLGLKFSGVDSVFGFCLGKNDGDRIAYQEQICRVQNIPLETITKNYNQIKRYANTVEAYKASHNVMDHTDIIQKFTEEGEVPDIKVVFVDEAQDLSPTQWGVVRKVTSNPSVERVYYAGDDDQSIYSWAGADVETFLNLKGEQVVLPRSHRLPKSVFKVATSISAKIQKRFEKDWSPREEEGCVTWCGNLGSVPLHEGEWLVLARANYLLTTLERFCFKQGYAFISKGKSSINPEVVSAIQTFEMLLEGKSVNKVKTTELMKKIKPEHKTKRIPDSSTLESLNLPRVTWQEIFDVPSQWYYEKIKNLHEKPRITISTIHSVKGGEADNVLLVTDIPPGTKKEMVEKPDDEHRVFYVAATRARHNLYLLRPQTPSFYKV